MRLSRMLFGLPLAGLLIAAALTFLSPAPSVDLSIASGGISYQVPEYALVNAILPADPALTAEAAIDKPRDAHRHVYVVANRPLAAWRIAADTTFMLIDPHIAV